MPLGHLVQIDEDAWVALVEAYALVEEHRGVAVGVERDDAVVYVLGCTELSCLIDEPLKDGQSRLQPLGMPLHAENSLIFCTLHALDDTIGSMGRDAETLPPVGHCLMVETVDIDFFLAIDVVENTIAADVDRMCQLRLPCILIVTDRRSSRLTVFLRCGEPRSER